MKQTSGDKVFVDTNVMIIAAAIESGCQILYSEDMQHKQQIERKLTIINPYL